MNQDNKQKTARVRIAVDVNTEGEYHALGWVNHDLGGLNDELSEWDFDDLNAKVHRVWVEADVPLPPHEPVIEGTATGEKV